MSQFFHKLLGYKGIWTLSRFQVNSLRVQAKQLQNPRDFKAGKNQNGIKLKSLSTFPGKAKISGQDLSKSWFCKSNLLRGTSGLDHAGPLLPSHEGLVREQRAKI